MHRLPWNNDLTDAIARSWKTNLSSLWGELWLRNERLMMLCILHRFQLGTFKQIFGQAFDTGHKVHQMYLRWQFAWTFCLGFYVFFLINVLLRVAMYICTMGQSVVVYDDWFFRAVLPTTHFLSCYAVQIKFDLKISLIIDCNSLTVSDVWGHVYIFIWTLQTLMYKHGYVLH